MLSNRVSTTFAGLASVGYHMSQGTAVAAKLEVATIMDLLQDSLRDVNASDLGCPRVAPSVGVVSCTYHQWFMPFSRHRRYCQLSVSGRVCVVFCSLGLALIHCLLLLAALRVGDIWPEQTEFVPTVMGFHC